MTELFGCTSDTGWDVDAARQSLRSTTRCQRSLGQWFSESVLPTVILLFLCAQSSQSIAQQTLVVDINVIGLNANQLTAITQLAEACDSLNGDTSEQAIALQQVCDLIDSLDPNDPTELRRLQEITEAVVPEEAFALNDSLVVFSDYQATNVHARLTALRQPASDSPANWQTSQSRSHSNDHGYELIGQSGAGASGELLSRLGGFINGHVSNGEIDGAVLQQDSDFSSSSLTFGSDYRFSDNVVAGVGLGVLQNETSFNRVSGGAQADGFNVTAFATWYETDEGYLDIVLDLGRTDHELKRSVSIFPDTSLIAISSPTSTAKTMTVSAGRNFKPGGWDLGGYFRLSYTRATIDAYSESLDVQQPGFAALFSIDDQSVVSTKMVAGLELSKALSTSRAVLVPLVRIEYVTEREREKDDIKATLITTGTVASYQGEDRVTGYSNLGIGASAVFKNGRSAYAYYETHLQHDLVSQDWLKAGIRLEF